MSGHLKEESDAPAGAGAAEDEEPHDATFTQYCKDILNSVEDDDAEGFLNELLKKEPPTALDLHADCLNKENARRVMAEIANLDPSENKTTILFLASLYFLLVHCRYLDDQNTRKLGPPYAPRIFTAFNDPEGFYQTAPPTFKIPLILNITNFFIFSPPPTREESAAYLDDSIIILFALIKGRLNDLFILKTKSARHFLQMHKLLMEAAQSPDLQEGLAKTAMIRTLKEELAEARRKELIDIEEEEKSTAQTPAKKGKKKGKGRKEKGSSAPTSAGAAPAATLPTMDAAEIQKVRDLLAEKTRVAEALEEETARLKGHLSDTTQRTIELQKALEKIATEKAKQAEKATKKISELNSRITALEAELASRPGAATSTSVSTQTDPEPGPSTEALRKEIEDRKSLLASKEAEISDLKKQAQTRYLSHLLEKAASDRAHEEAMSAKKAELETSKTKLERAETEIKTLTDLGQVYKAHRVEKETEIKELTAKINELKASLENIHYQGFRNAYEAGKLEGAKRAALGMPFRDSGRIGAEPGPGAGPK